MLLTVLFVVGFSLFSWVSCFGLWLSNDNESIIFQLSYLFLSEVADLWLRVRTVIVVFFLLLFLDWVLLSILWLIVALLTILISLSAVALVSSSSSFSVVLPLLVSVSLSCRFYFLCFNRLSQGSWLNLNCNHSWSLLNFLNSWNWGNSGSLNLGFRLRSANNSWSLHNCNWDNNSFFLDLFNWHRLHFNFLIQNITNNLFFVADNRCYFAVAVLLNIGSHWLLKFLVICKVLEGVAERGDRVIEGGEGLVTLLEGVPQMSEFIAFWEFGSCMIDGNESCKGLEFLELISTIVCDILLVGLFEECCNILNTNTFF